MQQQVYRFKVNEVDDKGKKYFIARLYYDDNECVGISEGKDKHELFEMVADAYCCIEDVRVSWWDKLIHKIFRVM